MLLLEFDLVVAQTDDVGFDANFLIGVADSIHLIADEFPQLVHPLHRSLPNFIMNLFASLGTYCFLDTKPTVTFDF